MLDVKAVRKGYEDARGRVEVLAGVDLAGDPGEFVCLYGASGSGKTTLLHLVAGLGTPDTGSISIDGTVISRASEAARAKLRLSHVGVVFQHDNLIGELSAWENVALPLLGLGRMRTEARELSLAALEMVGLAPLADRSPARLSGGERQRVGIARGLVGDRKLLVADEPTGSLDSENSSALFALMRGLCASTGVAILAATHDPLARVHASRSVTMRDGRTNVE